MVTQCRKVLYIIRLIFEYFFQIFNVPLLSKGASNYFKKIVVDTIITRERENIFRPDMINLLIEAKRGQLMHDEKHEEDTCFATVDNSDEGKTEKNKLELSEDDLAAQAMIFFLAGFETTSSFMSFMAMELAINPEVQKKLQEEIQDVSNNCKGNVMYDAIMKMKYMDQVVSGK